MMRKRIIYRPVAKSQQKNCETLNRILIIDRKLLEINGNKSFYCRYLESEQKIILVVNFHEKEKLSENCRTENRECAVMSGKPWSCVLRYLLISQKRKGCAVIFQHLFTFSYTFNQHSTLLMCAHRDPEIQDQRP